MRWHVYDIIPIDFGWEFLKSVRDTAADLGAREAAFQVERHFDPGLTPSLASFIQRWDSAREAATKQGWEGDFRGEPVVFWVPTEDGFDFGFAFKQDNNGTTFIVSPKRMLHLEP
ncbi:hypothetical protein [Achromobacter xylosoxidans]|uniref:hypothetical protein n=1 Tax=Alcaligenes xylosoxydans xylosoxydans TaxID=85698 RepID=UPI001177D726|nr:hypothetical protein [Achromobacter xylosoxidans]